MEHKNSWIVSTSRLGKIMLLLSLSVAFLDIKNIITYGIMSAWIAVAAGKFLLGQPAMQKYPALAPISEIYGKWGLFTGNVSSRKSIVSTFLFYNFGSRVVIYIYTLQLILVGATESRFFSTNAMTFVNGLSAAGIFYLFGPKAITYSTIAACLSWIYSVIGVVARSGFVDFFKQLEFHDLSFGVGYVLLYFLCLPRKWKLRDYVLCVMVALIVVCANKRIGLAALAAAWLVWFVLLRVKMENRRKLLRIGSLCAIAACYLFVVMILEGWMVSIADAVGVNVMGRNYYYEALASHCDFVPWFLGLGRNASATLFTTDYAYMNVGNVHSDILRMYAECGFVLFGLWLAVYWWFLPRALEKKFGNRAMEFFLICTIYTFIVYTTDNTELYLVNQYFYMLAPMTCAIKWKPKTSKT